MFESILNHIQTRLKEIPGLRYIDEDWGQLSAAQAPVAWPCALIDVDGFQYSQIGHHAQRCDLLSKLYLCSIGNNKKNVEVAKFLL